MALRNQLILNLFEYKMRDEFRWEGKCRNEAKSVVFLKVNSMYSSHLALSFCKQYRDSPFFAWFD